MAQEKTETVEKTAKPKTVKKKKATLLENVKVGKYRFRKGELVEVTEETYDALLEAKVIAAED